MRTTIVMTLLAVAMCALAREPSKKFQGYYRGYLEQYAAAPDLPPDANAKIAVIGYVKNPNTVIQPENGLTVSKAIERAGGFADFADHAHVGIFRSDEGRFLMMSLYEVKDGKSPDLVLFKGDIVIVTGRWMNGT